MIHDTIDEKYSSLNFPLSEFSQANAWFCSVITQCMSFRSSGHRKLDMCLMSSFSFLSAVYLPFGTKSSGFSSNFGMSFKGSPFISLIILNLFGKVPKTGLIFKATSLYFLAKQTMSAYSSRSASGLSSSMAVTVLFPVPNCFSSVNNYSKTGFPIVPFSWSLFCKYNNCTSFHDNSSISKGKTSKTKGFPSRSISIIQGTSRLVVSTNSSRFIENMPGSLAFEIIFPVYRLVSQPSSLC